jgi:ribosome maturation factor RimP
VNTAEKIRVLVEEVLKESDKFLVDFVVQQGDRITVFIDGDNGVTIDDCQYLSRAIENHFDRDREDFDLTVSSAGLDHPLRTERQYRKNMGREIQVNLHEGSPVEGILVRVDTDSVELEHPVTKPKKEIQKPNTVIPFSLIKTAKIIIKFRK